MEGAIPTNGTHRSARGDVPTAPSGRAPSTTSTFQHLPTSGRLARDVDIGPPTMGNTMSPPKRTGSRTGSMRRVRGFGAVEEVLIVAALMGCFVYPMSQAARSTGQQIAAQMESAHTTLLTQR
jgi:hypothetical protein